MHSASKASFYQTSNFTTRNGPMRAATNNVISPFAHAKTQLNKQESLT